MLNIAICDDNLEERTLIESEAKKILNELDVKFEIYKLNNKEEMFLYLGNGNINILLLDVCMPDINGFEIAKRFGDKVDFVIFISGNDNYVFEAVKYSPYRFIRKSNLGELYEAFKSIIEYYSNGSYFIDIKTINNGRTAVKLKDIVYIESQGDKLTIFTEKYEYEVRDSLKNIETRLGKNFMRVHRGFIINLNKIYQIKRFDVELAKNGGIVTIPLKRNLHTEVKQRFVEVMRKWYFGLNYFLT